MARAKKLPKVLSEDEQQAFLQTFNLRYQTPRRNHAMCRVMLEAGLRLGEVLALQPDHVDMMTGKLIVREGKGAKDRTLWINDDLREQIGEWLSERPESEVLFPTRTGARINPRYVRRMVKKAAKKAEIAEWEKVSPHTLRHTFATDFLRERKNLRMVQKALGHADISTTQIYTHIVDEELEEAMKGFKGSSPNLEAS